MNGFTDISWCNIAQIIGESNRFLFHVMLVHTATTIVEGKKEFFGEDFFRTLVVTATAIIMYHLFFRKIVEPKVEKMKLICYEGKDRTHKLREIDRQYESSEQKSKTIKTQSKKRK